MLIDTHAHLYIDYYDDISKVIENANSNGIKYIVSAGVDNKTNDEMLELVKRTNNVYVTLGIHPENIDLYNDSDLTLIESNLNNPYVIAIGEIGLDYHYENHDRAKQIDIFEKQLKIAEKNDFPVVIHSREATEDTINILKKYHVRGVIHSFSGSLEIAREYIKMGFYLGINGVVTFKNANIKKTVASLGLEHFVLETDSPYLTPEPYRGKQNTPSNILTIANFLAEYLEIPVQDVASITSKNALALFDKLVH